MNIRGVFSLKTLRSYSINPAFLVQEPSVFALNTLGLLILGLLYWVIRGQGFGYMYAILGYLYLDLSFSWKCKLSIYGVNIHRRCMYVSVNKVVTLHLLW